MTLNGWVGVDLDGTLAYYDGWGGVEHVGPPIPKMVERVKKWIADGIEVRIFTARVWTDGNPDRRLEVKRAEEVIRRWCLEHIGAELQVTCVKDFAMIELWDDRAVRVIPNTGETCCAAVAA